MWMLSVSSGGFSSMSSASAVLHLSPAVVAPMLGHTTCKTHHQPAQLCGIGGVVSRNEGLCRSTENYAAILRPFFCVQISKLTRSLGGNGVVCGDIDIIIKLYECAHFIPQ